MYENIKERVCIANKNLVKHNLVLFTWGNVSEIDREKGIIAIKPSGVKYEQLKPKDIVIIDLEGNLIEGDMNPSSDTKTHLELYNNFLEIKSIVHTHSTYATIFSQSKKEINCLGTTHADHFYGSIPVIKQPTDKEINKDYEKNTGKAIVNYFIKHKINPLDISAALVESHGPFVWGKSIDKAVYNAVVLEQIAKMNLFTFFINSEITPIKKTLLDKHYLRKHGKNSYYGQKQEK